MSRLVDDVEGVTVVGDAGAVPTDGAGSDGATNPLVPNLDTVGVLANIDGSVSAVASSGEGGDGGAR